MLVSSPDKTRGDNTWQARVDDRGQVSVTAGSTVLASAINGRLDAGTEPGLRERLSSARLMAAAPEMYTALTSEEFPTDDELWNISYVSMMTREYQTMLEHAEARGYKDEDPAATADMLRIVERFCDRAKAAIAKARG